MIQIKKKYPEIFDNKISIALHIRRNDYLRFSDKFSNLCDSNYYENSINYIKNKFDVSKIKLIVFSDDPKWCKEYMKQKFPELNTLFPTEKDYIELYLMSCCKHQIIANSSFSWWGAYMKKNPEKLIIAPKNWFGPKGPPIWDTIYMDDWIRI